MRSIDQMTLADLRRALDEKERELRALIERQERLAAQVDELGETLHAMLAGGGAAPGRSDGDTAHAAAAKRTARATRSAARRAASDSPARRGRPPRENSLPVVIRSVLERVLGPMRVAEIAAAVVKAGYATTSKNLPIIVANRLAKMEDVEKVDRGLYQLRRGASSSGNAETTLEPEAAAEQTAS
jgi:hypothetical protein